MPIVGDSERQAALDHGTAIVKHYLDRVHDSLNAAENLLTSSIDSPDTVINEINRAANIAGRAQQASNIWKGLAIDVKKKNTGEAAK